MTELQKKYINNMTTAYKWDYARAVPIGDMRILIQEYEKETNKKVTLSPSCSTCQLKLLKMFYDLWVKNKSINNEEEKQEEVVENKTKRKYNKKKIN
jgi:hypothetical protein